MKVRLQYGAGWLQTDVPAQDVTVLEPKYVEGLPDEEAAFRAAVRKPVNCRPLREVVNPSERIAIVIPDITRPLVTDRLLRWTLDELSHVPEERITIINGTGSHRANSESELADMVGRDVLARYRIINHSAHEPETMLPAGKTPDGRTVMLNRQYVESDRRIVLGFIEPHFMSGFSGGYKGIFPALADIDSIMHYHRASVIGDPASTWGLLEGNPTQAQIRANGSLMPVDFLINVTQNRKRRITGLFCGDVSAAHGIGCEFARANAMIRCDRLFPLVITTNSGYPLDQNLYQSVKGISAAAQIVTQGGTILAVSECREGFPEHGNFRKLMTGHRTPAAILETILQPGFSMYDQWEAQLLAIFLLKAHIGLYSTIAAHEVRCAHLEPIADIAAFLRAELARLGSDVPVAVIPEGPMTIPYLSTRAQST